MTNFPRFLLWASFASAFGQPLPAQNTAAAPWSAPALTRTQAPAVYLAEWRKAVNRRSCAPVAFASLPQAANATPRRAHFSGGWGVAYDTPKLRSAFGIAGAGVNVAEPSYDNWPFKRNWSDGSRVGYGPEGGTGPNQLAYLRIAGQGCLYNVWSRLGRAHLEQLLQQIRFIATDSAQARAVRPLLPIEFEHSAEFGWLKKPVLANRLLDDMRKPDDWRMTGTATLSFPPESRLGDTKVLRVDMQMFTDSPAPTRSRLSSVNLRRAFPNEDWSGYNRISMWIRPEVSGFPMLPMQIVLHNDGATKVPDVYGREGIHYVTLSNNQWQQVVWEIDPLARDRVTAIEIGYWVNKMLAAPGDRVAFEIGRMELQRVEPDHHTGWQVA
ncbi:MAG TPA: hypothetical protein VGD27_16880, partial [Longimicrobiales bacterium]